MREGQSVEDKRVYRLEVETYGTKCHFSSASCLIGCTFANPNEGGLVVHYFSGLLFFLPINGRASVLRRPSGLEPSGYFVLHRDLLASFRYYSVLGGTPLLVLDNSKTFLV